VPFVINDYWANAVLLPFLIYAIAAIGLNILTGYCGQVSLGTGGFMAVGAYTSYKLMTAFPVDGHGDDHAPVGVMTAMVGVMFGLPSLRIKGFYLAVATLAAQFFLVWLFNKVPWFYNYSASGQINAPERFLFGQAVTGPNADTLVAYLFCFVLRVRAGLDRAEPDARVHRAPVDGDPGHGHRRRDHRGEPAEGQALGLRGVVLLRGHLRRALFTVYLGAVEVGEAFGIQKSFLVLFMIIIGGLGSIFGSFAGAAFMVLLPVLLKELLVDTLGWPRRWPRISNS
jgi:branched-chain amino acid transport system permease protein